MDKEDSDHNIVAPKDDKLDKQTDSTPLGAEMSGEKHDSAKPTLTSMGVEKSEDKEDSPKAGSSFTKTAPLESTKSESTSPNPEKMENRESLTLTGSTPLGAKDEDGKEERSKVDTVSPNVGKVEDQEKTVIADSIPPSVRKLGIVQNYEKQEDGGGESHDKMQKLVDLDSKQTVDFFGKMSEDKNLVVKVQEATRSMEKNLDKEDLGEQSREENLNEEDPEPVFDGTEIPGMEANSSLSNRSSDLESDGQSSNWPEKAVALKNLVREKSFGAVSNMLRRLSGKSDDNEEEPADDENNKEGTDSNREGQTQEGLLKVNEKLSWNPFTYFRFSRDADSESNVGQQEVLDDLTQPIPMKGRAILYTRLGCQECREARLFLYRKRLRYVEINIEVYPSRKLELEKISGSSSVPKVFFNEVLIGGISEMKGLEESGKLKDKLDYLISEAPSPEAPLPPLSGEDDMSSSGSIDELAVVVRKMKDSVIVKDRFYKMRWFTNCFVGSEAVDFLSEDQYLEREEAVEFGRKLASKLFFQHILDENVFEDGNHFYRFLEHDPIVSTQCHNIPRGIIEVKPKPITEIASRLRFLTSAIYDAYTSEDGKHVDCRSIHGSEEFARYLRIVEELQRVELQDMSREDTLAFFINLYNMMAIHAILVWGHPVGPLERRKLFGDFKYVVGGCTYSLSAIQNGILRGNQRPPYNLMKPFGAKDKRAKVALPYAEPLVHFALVCGTRSGPALRCYSPGNIDKELVGAARDFLRGGGLIFDLNAKVASVSKIIKWFSADFGKNEMEVLKHALNYFEPADAEALLELLSSSQLKVTYQPYDWGLNC